MQQDNDQHGPGLKFPPPLLPLFVVGLGWLMQRWLPLPIVNSELLWWPGVLVLLTALLLAITSVFQFIVHKTKVEPWQPTARIIRSGLFRYSRNPIYLAFCIATGASGLMFNSWWPIIALPLLLWLLWALVIRKEEAYLANKFGDSYLQYCAQVRRWL